ELERVGPIGSRLKTSVRGTWRCGARGLAALGALGDGRVGHSGRRRRGFGGGRGRGTGGAHAKYPSGRWRAAPGGLVAARLKGRRSCWSDPSEDPLLLLGELLVGEDALV